MKKSFFIFTLLLLVIFIVNIGCHISPSYYASVEILNKNSTAISQAEQQNNSCSAVPAGDNLLSTPINTGETQEVSVSDGYSHLCIYDSSNNLLGGVEIQDKSDYYEYYFVVYTNSGNFIHSNYTELFK